MTRIYNQQSQDLTFKNTSKDGLLRTHKYPDDFSLFICDRCKRQCALLTKETHKPIFCPFFNFEINNSSYIFKF